MFNRLIIPLLFLMASSAPAAVSIHRVIPDKILYRTGAEASVEVVVENPDDIAFDGSIRLVETWGVNEHRAITEVPLKLAGREKKTLVFKWNTGSVRYGREIAAEVLAGDKIVARRTEFFNVINEWWRVNQIVGTCVESDEATKVLAYYHVNFPRPKFSFYGKDRSPVEIGPFLDYGNHANQFSTMPSNFGDMTPDVPEDQTWYNGQCGFGFTTAKLKEDLAWRRKWGIPTSIYTIPTFCGPAGFEIARRRPDWVARDENGAFKSSGDTISPLELANPITVGIRGWNGVEPDLLNIDCVRFGAEELNHTIRMFGWEAVYFDYTYVPNPQYTWDGQRKPEAKEIGAIAVRNNRLVREIIRKEYPDTYMWCNNNDPSQIIPFEPAGNLGGKEGKVEFLSDTKASGTLKECQAGQVTNPTFFAHAWRALFEMYLGVRDSIRLKDWGRPLTDVINTGYLYPEQGDKGDSKENQIKTRSQWAWCNHVMALMAASQMHPCVGGASAAAFRPFNQFMTRYSEFLWHEDLRIEKKAFKLFAVDSLRRIWWEDGVLRRDLPDCEEFVLHLVNVPDEENAHMLIVKDPAGADDVEVTLLKTPKADGIQAWAMMPYGYDSVELAPVQVELKAKIVDGDVVFAVPPFTYYAMIVIRRPKTGKTTPGA